MAGNDNCYCYCVTPSTGNRNAALGPHSDGIGVMAARACVSWSQDNRSSRDLRNVYMRIEITGVKNERTGACRQHQLLNADQEREQERCHPFQPPHSPIRSVPLTACSGPEPSCLQA